MGETSSTKQTWAKQEKKKVLKANLKDTLYLRNVAWAIVGIQDGGPPWLLVFFMLSMSCGRSEGVRIG